MTSLRTGRHERRRARAEAAPTLNLGDAVKGLMGAVDEGRPYLPADDVRAAEAVLTKAGERLALSGAHTVVALAGATGSGKSTLFNRLVGEDVSRAGHLRPTTSRAVAAVWGADSAADLLDWVGVSDRHRVGGRAPSAVAQRYGATETVSGAGALGLDGLVLLDLPDVDSTAEANRREADRVLALADVFVWVTDPQKYADAVLHDHYLARARHHEAVTLVVLNQADRMRPDEAAACRDDLRRLLARDGLEHVEVLLCSARTGQGLAEVKGALTGAVVAATAARARLLGDLRDCATDLRADVADTEPDLGDGVDADLVEALARSAGAPVVLRSVELDQRRRALARTGWPLTRWVRGLRADPLKRLRLDARTAPADEVTPFPDELGALVARSSVPEPTPAARAAVDLVTRRLGARAAAGLPPQWADAVHDRVGSGPDLTDALDQAVLQTPLRARAPFWWPLVAVLQWALLLTGVAGLGWLVFIAAMSWFGLPPVQVPSWGYVPIPTVLFFAGFVGGLLLGAVSAVAARAGARRHRLHVQGELYRRIALVADEQVLAPLREILRRHRATREHLDAVLGD